MIAVDSSALVAVVLGEPEAETMLAALREHPATIGAPTLLEASIVVEARHGPEAIRDLDLVVTQVIGEVVAFDHTHVRVAMAAWRRFGKGRHPAALNFGDCLAYATAAVAGARLLFKGNDFSQTDIASVL